MGRVSYGLLCCSGWKEEDGDRLLECFQFLFIKGKWVAGLVVVLVLGFFPPVLNCGVVAMQMLLIFPVPTGYLIPLIACKPFK